MRLVERLGGAEPASYDLDAVARSLRNLLVAQPGFGSIHPDFGLGELSRFANDVQLEERLGKLVARWEPRLDDPRVTAIGRDPAGRLHFKLEARMDGQECELLLLIDSHLNDVSVEVES
jgi:predicted component of type VI protein secretion system